MKRIATLVAAVGGALLVVALAPDLAWAAAKEKRVALVVGNSSYQTVPKLPNPSRDASSVAKLFKDAGFDAVEVLDDVGNLEFKRGIRKFEDTASDADIAVIFYAGHGIEIGGTNYLIPIDARLASDRDALDEAIPLERLVASADGAKKLRVVILDACRDNPFAGKMRRESRAALRAVSSGLSKIEPTSTDTLIAYAAKAGSTAEDGERDHSPFTTALLKNIAVPGLDLRLAFGRVKDEVMKLTGNRQEPFVYGSLGGGNYSLVPAPEETKEAPATAADVKADYELVAKIGSRRSWEVFLGTHKTGFYADLARAQLAGMPPNVEVASLGPSVPSKRTPTSQEQLEWDRIRDSSDTAALSRFIKRFPDSPLALNAQKRIDVLDQAGKERDEKARSDRAEAERQKAKAAEAAQKARAEEAERKAAEAKQKADEAARSKATTESARLQAESERSAREAENERRKAQSAAEQEAACKREGDRLNAVAAKGSEGSGLDDIRLLAMEATCERIKPQVMATLEKFDTEVTKRTANTPDLIRLAQNNLNRIGCAAGEANGVLTDETKSALARYLSNKGRSTGDLDVTKALVTELGRQIPFTCNMACPTGQSAKGNTCIANVQPSAPAKTVKRKDEDEAPRKKPAPKQAERESKPAPRAREQAQARPSNSGGGGGGSRPGATMIGVGF